MVLTAIAAGCLSASVRVDRPVATGLMYGWFATVSFFASWVSQTQARLPR
jgi:hypothetical protein